jgi:hypothetical protein
LADCRFKKGHAAWNKVQWIEKVCPKCQAKFSVKPSLDRVVHCSRSCARLGEASGAKGRKFGPARNRGVPMPPAARAKLKETLAKIRVTGPEHFNWRGGKRSERKQAMARLEYREWRTSVFERDDYTCQECGERGGTIHADHIKPWSTHPNLRFDVGNGRTLCVPCHCKTPSFPKQLIPKEIQIG